MDRKQINKILIFILFLLIPFFAFAWTLPKTNFNITSDFIKGARLGIFAIFINGDEWF